MQASVKANHVEDACMQARARVCYKFRIRFLTSHLSILFSACSADAMCRQDIMPRWQAVKIGTQLTGLLCGGQGLSGV